MICGNYNRNNGRLKLTRFILYLIRWQLSTPILAACCYYLGGLGVTVSTILANLIGGCIFYFVDKRIFKHD